MDFQYENVALMEIGKQNFTSDKIKCKILEEWKLIESLLSQNHADNDNFE